MAAGNTYEAIATQTLGSAAASVTFSSIPGSYTDLVLVIAGTLSGGDSIGIRYNGDTGTNYSYTALWGNGTSATSARGTNETYNRVGAMYTDQSNAIINIQNYSNTTTYKTTINRYNNASNQVGTYVSLWRNTAAITSLVFSSVNGASLQTGSTFTLYGVKSA